MLIKMISTTTETITLVTYDTSFLKAENGASVVCF